MTEAKPSGIRPPSKIDRTCCALPPRPAIPPLSPKSSGNTSVVLTEDTDSFIIGDRVWVGGTKPGAIAYIGETQFAPGDWAGVVLDEPIGKNDGSVAGCRYFQCEPKRGIFSRLTRLTRQPLPEASLSSPTHSTPTTPPDSTRGFLAMSVSSSLNASTTSLSSTVSQRDLKIGDRVIVSSSQGSKTGVLRYMGTTEFAPGEWCGVELDEPLGKNDGSVADKRYFECRPKYGLFAPAHKVSRSPSSKRTSCVVHKPSGAALNSTLKRTNSRESVASISSVSSSIAGSRIGTGATREMLKEKQQEIEFLRRERDLERDRVTKAANQADQAEQSVVSIKQEYDKYREEMQRTVVNAETALKQLLEEKNTLAVQLEEERRKCEDLLFRFEEESVNKNDIQKKRSDQSVINTVNENRIKELEKQLSEERERVIQLDRESTKLFEAEEELARLRSERTVANSQDKSELEDLRSFNESLKETKVVLEKEIKEKTVLVENYLENIKNLEIKLNEKEKENVLRKQAENELQNNLQETKQSLEEKIKYVESMKEEFESSTNALKKELGEMKKTIDDINKQHANEKQSLISEYEKIIEDKNKQIESKAQQLANESQKHLESQSTVLENLKAENIKHINELSESFGQQLNVKDSKIKEISTRLNEKLSETQKLLSELSNQQDLYNKKDKELNDTLGKLKELNSQLKEAEDKNLSLSNKLKTHELAAEDTKALIEEKSKLEEDLRALRATALDSNANLEKLSEELKTKDNELVETRTQIEELKKNFQQEMEEKSRYIEEIRLDASNKSWMLGKIDKEISELRSILESKDEEIKHLTEKNSELHYALTLSEQTKNNLESELRVFESNIENLNQQLARADEKLANTSLQKEKLESDIANLISNSANSSEQLTKYNEELREKEQDIDQLRDKVYQAENALSTTQGKLQNTEQELKKNVTLLEELRLEVENVKGELSKEKAISNEYSEKIKLYELKEKEFLETIEKAKASQKDGEEMSSKIFDFTERLKKLEEEKMDLEKQRVTVEESFKKESSNLQLQLDDVKTQLTASQEEVKVLQKAKSKLEADQSANRWSIEELTEKLDLETESRTKLESAILEKDTKIMSLENMLSELQREKNTLSVNKESIHQDLTKTINTMENTIAELNNKLVVATGTIESKSNELAIAQAEAMQRKIQISQLTDEIGLLKKAQSQVNDKMHNLEDTLKQKENELCTIEDHKCNLESNIKQLEIEIKNVQTEVATKDNLLAEFNEKIKNLQNSNEDSLIKLQDKFDNEMKAKESVLEAIKKRNAELEKEKESLQTLVAAKTADLSTKETVNNLQEQSKNLQDTHLEKMKAKQESGEETNVTMNEVEELRKQCKNISIKNDSFIKLIEERDKSIQMLTNTIKNNEMESMKNTQNLMEKLDIITKEATELKEAQSRLEKENKQISSKLAEASNQLKLSRENIKNNIDAAGGDAKQQMVDTNIDMIKLKEENETVKTQIDFLNSVIVDMQRKNETLLHKIETLEKDVPSIEAGGLNLNFLEKKDNETYPFCYICFKSNLHDPENCPNLADRLVEWERYVKRPTYTARMSRPYCDYCETFGHNVLECDENTETY